MRCLRRYRRKWPPSFGVPQIATVLGEGWVCDAVMHDPDAQALVWRNGLR